VSDEKRDVSFLEADQLLGRAIELVGRARFEPFDHDHCSFLAKEV
jgi:fibrillarin-like rRNA methylase